MYEKNFLTLKEARQAQKIVGGTITSFLSIDQDFNIIKIYRLTYKQLF